MAAFAAHVTACLLLSPSNSTSLHSRTSLTPVSHRITPRKLEDAGVVSRRMVVRAQETKTEGLAKDYEESNKMKGAPLNQFTPENPYIGTCLINRKLTGAPHVTRHIVCGTEGMLRYVEGQTIGFIPEGRDQPSLYSIASCARGDFGDSKTLSLCVRCTGVGAILCNLKPGGEMKITGPVLPELLMPKDPNATIVMLATGTGIAPFRGFLWKMFWEEHEHYKFTGLAWLVFGVPTESSILYKEEFDKMQREHPEKFCFEVALSREQTNEKGEKMYVQTRLKPNAKKLWELMKKNNTFVYVSGLMGMVAGIDEVMAPVAEEDGIYWPEYKKELERLGRWNVLVY